MNYKEQAERYIARLEKENNLLSQHITELEDTIDQKYVRKLEENNSLLFMRINKLEDIICDLKKQLDAKQSDAR